MSHSSVTSWGLKNLRKRLLYGGWIIGIFMLAQLSCFIWNNREAPDALAAVSVLGGLLIGIYGIFVLGGDTQNKPSSKKVLGLILTADVFLFGLRAQFMTQDVQVNPQRDIVVAYVWDINSGEMFPKGTAQVSKTPWSYAYLAERVVQECLRRGVLKEPNEPKVGILANRCGLLPGYDLTQLVILKYLGMVFAHSWEAKFAKTPSLAKEERAGIEQYTGGRSGRIITRDDLIKQSSDNSLMQFLDPYYALTVPSDVKLKIGKGPVRSQDAFCYLLFEGHYCNAMVLIRGGVAGAKYPNWDSVARRTEVDVRLVADCDKSLRGHPEMASRVAWVNRLLHTVEDGLSVQSVLKGE